jgi:four helix bundle protein
MTTNELKDRTKKFALSIINLTEKIPNTTQGRVICNQIIRSGTSVGANYRAAIRSRSKAEFISKLNIVQEEADETLYWLELLMDAKLLDEKVLNEIMKETNELVSIFTSSLKTLRNK